MYSLKLSLILSFCFSNKIKTILLSRVKGRECFEVIKDKEQGAGIQVQVARNIGQGEGSREQ